MKNFRFLSLVICVIAGIIFWYFVGSEQKLEYDISIKNSNAGRLLNVASRALDYYYIDYHQFPEPENGHLPEMLLDSDYIYTAFRSASGDLIAKTNKHKMPIDIYVSSGPQAVELWENSKGGDLKEFHGNHLQYYLLDDDFVVLSVGPDGKITMNSNNLKTDPELEMTQSRYDVSNGTLSSGDIFARSNLKYLKMTTQTLINGMLAVD